MNANPQLIDYIVKSREISKTDKEIQESLLKVGWEFSDIEEAFKEATPEETIEEDIEETQSETEEPKEEEKISEEEIKSEEPVEVTTESEEEEVITTTNTPEISSEIFTSPQEIKPAEEAKEVTKIQPKKQSKSKLFIIILVIILVIIGTLGAIIYLKPNLINISSLKDFFKKGQPGTEITKNNEQPAIITTNKNTIMAYTTKNEADGKMELFFYDTQTQQALPQDSVIQADNNSAFEIGPWSPTGQYLPILGSKISPNKEINLSLYLYDSQKKAATKIYDSKHITKTTSTIKLPNNFKMETNAQWIDNTKLKIMEDTSNTISTRVSTYITPEGKIDKIEQPKNINVVLNNITYKINSLTGTLIDTIKIGTSEIKVQPKEGSYIIGTINDSLVILEKMVLDSKNKTVLNFYSINDSGLVKTIDLTDTLWGTQSILIDPTQKYLIAQQTNSDLKPTQERYIQINPEEASNINLIFGQDISTEYPATKEPSLLKNLKNFYLSNDGEWIIGTRKYANIITAGSDIYMKNIKTGEENIICSNNCSSISVYYPQRVFYTY